MSTNRRTKKYDMLERQGGVALLVHDFSEAVPLPPPSSSSSSSGGSGGGVAGGGGVVSLTGEYSITLNGTCSVVEDGETLSSYAPRIDGKPPVYEKFVNGGRIGNRNREKLNTLSLSPLSLFTIVALPPVVLAEKYREIHLRNNPDYPQVSALPYIVVVYKIELWTGTHGSSNMPISRRFTSRKFIVGNDIAMLRVDVVTARICNISDEVIKWNVSETGSARSSSLLSNSNRTESFQI